MQVAPQLLREGFDRRTSALRSNFAQIYSITGFILSAMRLSRSWEDRYWRAAACCGLKLQLRAKPVECRQRASRRL
jgi:hypothetical protein